MRRPKKSSETETVETETVEMVRDGKTADVHCDEVDNWSRHGWKLAE